MMRVKTICEPCMFQAGPSVPFLKVENEDISFLTGRDCSQESFHGNDTMGDIWFLLRCTFLVAVSLKNTALIFP